MSIYTERAISGIKYAIAVITIFGGVSAMFTPTTPMTGALGFLYSTRIGLIIFGLVVVCAGATLFYGKVRRSRRLTGRGLMATYLCFVFATVINGMAAGWVPGAWIPNAVFAVITGALWVRWKFKTEYLDKNHFIDLVQEKTEQRNKDN